MKAEEFDKIFDDNEEDIIDYLDMSTIRRSNLEPKRINIDFPTWMVKKLDEEAKHIGVSRQAIIKTNSSFIDLWNASGLNGIDFLLYLI